MHVNAMSGGALAMLSSRKTVSKRTPGEPNVWTKYIRPLGPLVRAWRALGPRRSKPPHLVGERPLIVMLVISDVRNDPRVRREAEVLARGGYEVKIFSPDCYQPSQVESPLDWGPNISFRIIPCTSIQYYAHYPFIWGTEYFRMVIEERPFAIHCHDLNTCLVGLAAARTVGAYCICDFHEWYSENVTWDYAKKGWGPHPTAKRRSYKLLERLVMARADAVITVTESIADAIAEELTSDGRRPAVIRNIPRVEQAVDDGTWSVKREMGLPDDAFVVLWQGGIGPSRLLEPVIEAFAKVPDAYFAIRTPYWDAFGKPIEEQAAALGISDRIVRLEPCSTDDIVRSAFGADVGLWTLPNPSRNFYLALGNKIWEYLAADLPILVAHYPEAKKIVDTYQVGLSFDPYDPDSIAEAIRTVKNSPERLKAMKAQVPVAYADCDAGHEWDKLLGIYNDLKR